MCEPEKPKNDIKQSTYRQSFIFVAVATSIVNTALLKATLVPPQNAHGLERELVNIFQYSPYVLGPIAGIAITFILRGTLKKPVDDQGGENG
ncbi:hypothetical protein VCRA2110O2_30207 [Vibrio crassostreae]|nr:hypothetical protein VCHA44O286_50168 [Vibrio chagasii]CAK2861049.1 hypothetical protein VCRA2110O2_30207 [Vibrio crassostreae]